MVQNNEGSKHVEISVPNEPADPAASVVGEHWSDTNNSIIHKLNASILVEKCAVGVEVTVDWPIRGKRTVEVAYGPSVNIATITAKKQAYIKFAKECGIPTTSEDSVMELSMKMLGVKLVSSTILFDNRQPLSLRSNRVLKPK
jgi:hypothetical protein